MAEWSKAPDSRHSPCSAIQSRLKRFLVLDEGMGSNPISDKQLLTLFFFSATATLPLKEVSPTKRRVKIDHNCLLVPPHTGI